MTVVLTAATYVVEPKHLIWRTVRGTRHKCLCASVGNEER